MKSPIEIMTNSVIKSIQTVFNPSDDELNLIKLGGEDAKRVLSMTYDELETLTESITKDFGVSYDELFTALGKLFDLGELTLPSMIRALVECPSLRNTKEESCRAIVTETIEGIVEKLWGSDEENVTNVMEGGCCREVFAVNEAGVFELLVELGEEFEIAFTEDEAVKLCEGKVLIGEIADLTELKLDASH